MRPNDYGGFNFQNPTEGKSFLNGEGFEVREYGGVYGKNNKNNINNVFPVGVLDVDGIFHFCMIPRKPVEEDRKRLTKALESYIPDTSAAADASPPV